MSARMGGPIKAPRVRAVLSPASACPRCYGQGTALTFHTGTDTLPFECACGFRWLTTGKKAKAHAAWLDRFDRVLAKNVGDK